MFQLLASQTLLPTKNAKLPVAFKAESAVKYFSDGLMVTLILWKQRIIITLEVSKRKLLKAFFLNKGKEDLKLARLLLN